MDELDQIHFRCVQMNVKNIKNYLIESSSFQETIE